MLLTSFGRADKRDVRVRQLRLLRLDLTLEGKVAHYFPVGDVKRTENVGLRGHFG